MPEWKGYLLRNPASAGTLCHRESGYIQELAQEVALSKRLHTWVDGSLRDYRWFGAVLEDIKTRFPEYSRAIFYVHAPEHLIRQRILRRTVKTGRKIPENLIKECLQLDDTSIRVLRDKVDFVARVLNGDSKDPILETVESIDSAGNWNQFPVQFHHKFSPQKVLSNAFGPLRLMRTGITEFNLVFNNQTLEEISSSCVVEAKISAIDINLEKVQGFMETTDLYLSPLRAQNMSTARAFLALVPNEAHMFAWCNPAEIEEKTKCQLDVDDPNAMFFLSGGFVYFDVDFNVLGVNAVVGLNQKLSNNKKHMLYFGDSQTLSISSALALVRLKRWGSVTFPYLLVRGAKHLAWIVPGEKLGGVRFARFGGFALLSQSLKSLTQISEVTTSATTGCGMFYPMLG